MKHGKELCTKKGFWVGCLHAMVDPNVVKLNVQKLLKISQL